MKYCLHCKTLNENTQTHCTHCGKRLSNSKRITPIYCDPIVIAICFALWMFVIPLAAGVYLLMKQKSAYKENMNEYENALLFYGVKMGESGQINNANSKANEIISRANQEAQTIEQESEKTQKKAEQALQKLKEDQGKLQNNLAELQAEQEKERNYLEELQSEITYELS